MSARNGGPAFPCTPDHLDEGMTLRDYFAAKALANRYTSDDTCPHKVAQWAYQVADAMLTERAKGAGNE